MRRRAVVVLCWLLSLVPALAHAADGDLDLSFGTGGVVTDPNPATSPDVAMALGSDGNISVAEIEGGDLQLLRCDANGVLDPTFGSGGIVTQAGPSSCRTGISWCSPTATQARSCSRATCWQSVFSAAGLHRNDAGRFQGTSD